MERTNPNLKSYFAKIFVGLCALGTVLGIWAQATWEPLATKNVDLKKRIAEIVRESNERGKENIDGISISTKMPMNPKFIDEVKRYGEAAVPFLVGYLESDDQEERIAAVNFLGHIGGPSVIEPLRDVIDGESPSTTKIIALRWLGSIDDQRAKDIVLEISETATSDVLREEANSLRLGFEKTEKPR